MHQSIFAALPLCNHDTAVHVALPVVVKPGEEPCAVPVSVGRISVPVRPQHFRFEPVDDLVQLRNGLCCRKYSGIELVVCVGSVQRVKPLK